MRGFSSYTLIVVLVVRIDVNTFRRLLRVSGGTTIPLLFDRVPRVFGQRDAGRRLVLLVLDQVASNTTSPPRYDSSERCMAAASLPPRYGYRATSDLTYILRTCTCYQPPHLTS